MISVKIPLVIAATSAIVAGVAEHSDAVTVALITGVVAVLGLIASIIVALITKNSVDRVHESVTKVQVEVDGQMKELLRLARQEAKAEGVAKEKSDEAQRVITREEGAQQEKKEQAFRDEGTDKDKK